MNEKRLFGMLGFAMRAGKLVLGTDLICTQMAKRGCDKLTLVIISDDASEATKKKLTTKAEFYGIKCLTVNIPSETIGALLGKTYSPVCVGVKDEGFSQQIILAAEENN